MKKSTLILTLLILLSSTTIAIESNTEDFQVPQFDSQEEILYEFVAPFLFLYFMLFLALNLIFKSLFDNPNHPYPYNDTTPVKRYAALSAALISLAVMFSPFWAYIRGIMVSTGLLLATLFFAIILYIIYLIWAGN